MRRREIEKKRDAAGEFLEDSRRDFLAAKAFSTASTVFQAAVLLAEAYCLWHELDDEVNDLITDELHEEHVAEQLLSRIHSAGLEAAL